MGNYISTDQNVNFIFTTINEKFLLLHKMLLEIKNLVLKKNLEESDNSNTVINNINIIIENYEDKDGFTWDNYEIEHIE